MNQSVNVVRQSGGKRIREARKGIDVSKHYMLSDAIAIMQQRAGVKFDETVDVVIKLGVDPRHSDQMVRGVVAMPGGLGKAVRVAVFAKGAKADEALAGGADIVGAENLVDQIMKGEINFDRCIATPDMMGVVGRVAKILGPKGLMPNPKLGTVTMNVTEAVKLSKAGQVEFRVEKAGIIHAGVGRVSFPQESLVKNIKALVDAVNKAKPSGAKGAYFKAAFLSSSMGPSVRLDLSTLAA